MASKPAKKMPAATWTKSSPELLTLFAALAPKNPSVEQKKMFGYPCCSLNGNLFAGSHQQHILFRLDEPSRTELLRNPNASIFEPIPGRPMKDYVALSDPLSADRRTLKKWMARALDYASRLPKKQKKAKTTTKKPPTQVRA